MLKPIKNQSNQDDIQKLRDYDDRLKQLESAIVLIIQKLDLIISKLG